jgi:hypothetical protein
VPYERAVVVALVVVEFVKMAVEALVKPIVVPFTVPPPTVALFVVREPKVAEFPFTVVPVAVPK